MTQQRWQKRPAGSNWGDFGADDQIGKLNLLSPARRLEAAKEIREGLAFQLSLPLDYPGGNELFQHRHEPRFIHEKRGEGHNYNFRLSQVSKEFCDVISDEAVILFTQYSTQWDGLSHVGQMFDVNGDGKLEKVYYNGFRGGVDIVGPDEAASGHGAKKISMEAFATAGVQGRGVLVDLESLYHRERVAIGYEELMRALELQKVAIETGDFLCLYTGFADLVLEMKKKPDKAVLSRSCSALNGRDEKLLNWISDSGLVAICADNFAVEIYPALPGKGDSFPGLPLHNHCLFKQGIYLGELWYFAKLAEWLRAKNRWRFMLTAPPLRLSGAVGSPVTPIATV